MGNDYGYAEVFARQVAGLRAARVARKRGMAIFAITGARASSLARLADVAIRIPVSDTALAQELHMAVTHILCDIIERALSEA